MSSPGTEQLKLTWKPGYALAAIGLFFVEVAIALWVRDRFVRPYMGDVLAVILVYLSLRAVTKLRVWPAALASLCIGFLVEIGQGVNILSRLGLQDHEVARVVLGTSFSIADLLCYTAGIVLVLVGEHWRVAPLQVGATRFAGIRARLEGFQPVSGPQSRVYEFLLFGFKQGWACLFGALMLALLLGTHFFYPKDALLARYDFLTLGAIAIQAGMLAFRLETWREARIIAIFHIVGTIMELFKTYAGSWEYPEAGVLRIGAVPLFSGFMYAAVGSYIARIWRIFRIQLDPYPPLWTTALLAAAIYANFFAHHWLPDVRIGLFAATVLLFWRARFHYTPFRIERQMPVLLGFFLVSLFIWFAENIGTFANAWTYPSQRGGWHMVSISKLGSWYLLMIISVVLVSLLHSPGAIRRTQESQLADTASP